VDAFDSRFGAQFHCPHFPLMLTMAPQLVDMRPGIFGLTANGDLQATAFGLSEPTYAAGSVVPVARSQDAHRETKRVEQVRSWVITRCDGACHRVMNRGGRLNDEA
jgi:hypothetical protein